MGLQTAIMIYRLHNGSRGTLAHAETQLTEEHIPHMRRCNEVK